MSVVGSLPQNAIKFQEENGWASLYVFDTVMIFGVDQTRRPLHQRRRWLDQYLTDKSQYGGEGHVRVLDYVYATDETDAQGRINEMIDLGYEGAILKDPNAAYSTTKAWVKYKKYDTLDCQVIGAIRGKNQYRRTIGALVVAVARPDGELIEVGRVAPGTMEDRVNWHRDILANKDHRMRDNNWIVEVRYQEWGARGRLRHPRIVNRRYDLHEPDTVAFAGGEYRVVGKPS